MSEKFTPVGELEREIVAELFAMRDEKYRDFHARLIPDVPRERIIGVRTPRLRSYAKELFRSGRAEQFMQMELPYFYYEEMNLRAFLIEQIADFQRAAEEAERLMIHADNWATCDSMKPKIFAKNHPELIKCVEKWLKSEHTYVVRYGLVCLLTYFLGDDFDPHYCELAAAVPSGEYYIDMANAWFFSMALAKNYDEAVKYISERRLSVFVHNAAIQKSVESRQVPPETKKYLKTLKIK